MSDDTVRAGDVIVVDPSEPCAACGVAFGQHRGGGRIGMSAFSDDPEHIWSMFRARPTPLVPGGEFQFPKPRDWPSSSETADTRSDETK